MVGVARVGAAGQRIVPAVADHLELVRVELVLLHDGLADGVGAVIGKLADQVRGDDAFAAGVGVALDNDVGIAEPAGEFADLFQRGGDGRVILRAKARLVRLEGNHHRLGQHLAGARLGAHLHQRIGLEGRLGEVAHVLIFLGHGREDRRRFDFGRRHGAADGAEGLVDGRGAVPHDFKIRRVERVEEELRVLAVVRQVGVTFRDPAVFAHHVLAVLHRQAKGGGQGLGGASGVFAHHVHTLQDAAHQARHDLRVVAVEVVAHCPHVGDQMVCGAGRHHQARALELVRHIIDVRRPAHECVVGWVLHKDLGCRRRIG